MKVKTVSKSTLSWWLMVYVTISGTWTVTHFTLGSTLSLYILFIHIHTTYILNIIENANTFIYENMYIRKHTPCMRRANLKSGRRKQDTKFTRSSKRLLSFLAVRLDGLLPHRHTRLSTQSCLRWVRWVQWVRSSKAASRLDEREGQKLRAINSQLRTSLHAPLYTMLIHE